MNQAFPIALPARVLLPGFEIDLVRDELRTAGGAHVELRPRSFAVLRLLAANAGRLITKNEIIDKVWDDAVVTEDSLTQCIADIRRVIADDEHKVIRTVPRRGYLLVAEADPDRAAQSVRLDLPLPPALAPTGPTSPDRSARHRYITVGRVFLLMVIGSGAALYALNVANVRSRARPDVPQVASVGPSVALMPIEDLSGDRATADGLTEDVIAALSRFKDLRVLARNMTAGFAGKQNSPVEIGRLLKADYLIEGNIRAADGRTVIKIQLVDTATGTEIWSQAYEQSPDAPDDPPFHKQIASRISAAIGTWTGAIAANEIGKSQGKSAGELTAYECIAQGYAAANERVSGEHVRRAHECLRNVLEREPRNAGAWASLSGVLTLQRWYGLGLEPPESLDLDKRAPLADLGVAAAQRAVELAPNDPFSRYAAARAYFGICQRDLLRVETERALALNPNDPAVMGPLGNQLGFAGFWSIGRPMAEKAIALTGPSAPRWWWWVIAKDYWFRKDYANALDAFQKSYTEQAWLSQLYMAYELPFVQRLDEAKAHVAKLLRLKPGFTIREADAYYKMWCFEPAYREKMRNALRLAGLPE